MLVDPNVGHSMFCFMYGFSGYNRIKMHPLNAENINFKIPLGNFHYIVMLFGLKITGVTYQQAMSVFFIICYTMA